jgi:hypothetical protein
MAERIDSFCICDLSDKSKSELLRQINADQWQHSMYLPRTGDGRTDWDTPRTMEAIRDVLVDQISVAQARIREADRCLYMVVNEMIAMENRTEGAK